MESETREAAEVKLAVSGATKKAAAMKGLFGGDGVSLVGQRRAHQVWGRSSRTKWFFIVLVVEAALAGLSSVSFQSAAPLTSLSPCLQESTIWSISCLPAFSFLKLPPWPPDSFLMSAPANNPSHHAKKTHKQHPLRRQNLQRYLNHFTRNRLSSAVLRKQRNGNAWQGKERGLESWERRKNMLWQQLVFGITELKVLHAWEVLSIC